MTKDIAPNDESIFDRVRNGTWLKETYGLIKKRDHWVYTSWKRSGQHIGDLKTLSGTSDWCLNFCDGNKWLMYMAFGMEIMNLENFGRDFPGEWMTADLSSVKTEEEKDALRKEYKRKMDEDSVRTKKKLKRTPKMFPTSNGAIPVFDYWQIIANDNIKVDLFKNLLEGFRTPSSTPDNHRKPEGLSLDEQLKGFIHVSQNGEFPAETRTVARMKVTHVSYVRK